MMQEKPDTTDSVKNPVRGGHGLAIAMILALLVALVFEVVR